MATRKTVREVQHDLAAVLSDVGRGEEILITKRGQVIAKLVKANDAPLIARRVMPKFMERMNALFPEGSLPGPTVSELVSGSRDR